MHTDNRPVFLNGFVFLLLLAIGVVVLGGCGDKNPSSSVSSTATSLASGTATTGTAGTGGLFGTLLDSATNAPINDVGAAITVSLYSGTAVVVTVSALNNNTFTLTNVNAGFYSIEAKDANGIFRSSFGSIQITGGQTSSSTITLSRAPSSLVDTADITGRLVDTLHNAPIMFGKVEYYAKNASAPSYTTTTNAKGYFFMDRIPSGTWDLKFSMPSYQEVKHEVTVHSKTKITFRGTDVTSPTSIAAGRADGTALTGLYIGDVGLAPQFPDTGGIAGILRSQAGGLYTPLKGTEPLVLYYRTSSGNQTPAIIYGGFTTNTEGYVHLINLPSGFYTIADFGAIPIARVDGNNEIVDWSIGDDPGTGPTERAYAGWLSVGAGAITQLPSSGFGN
ncbi:MAG: carboxypeptidase-like regulatory domain-containing protein [Candidatus Riflebacteria bacterium]|nr:carboxypeptidase-like regulatory domain-containing protein [Candidatus Riflebacteria bacterium]